jgi:3-oxoacyl-[acyl-carrier-protein] synthase I
VERKNGFLIDAKMKEVYVVSDAIVSPLGLSTEANFAQLKNKVTAITLHPDNNLSPTPFWAALMSRDVLDSTFPQEKDSFTHFEKLCICSITKALEQSKLDVKNKSTLLVLSTTKGNVDLLLNSAFKPSRVYLSESAKVIQHFFGMHHTPLLVSNACTSGVVAINLAWRLLQQNEYETIIVCGADSVSEFTISGFEAFKALSPNPCKPFDANRDGTSLGEGAGCMILSTKNKQGIKVLQGFSSNDANHISGPSRDGAGLFIAVNKTLKANQNPTLDYISAHGTGTLYNDEMESKAFNLSGLGAVPVNSYKGYFGHTFGAAGIIESAITLESMRQNYLLSSLGYTTKSESVNLTIIEESHSSHLSTCLKTASGFGGCNAAVLFQKA